MCDDDGAVRCSVTANSINRNTNTDQRLTCVGKLAHGTTGLAYIIGDYSTESVFSMPDNDDKRNGGDHDVSCSNGYQVGAWEWAHHFFVSIIKRLTSTL